MNDKESEENDGEPKSSILGFFFRRQFEALGSFLELRPESQLQKEWDEATARRIAPPLPQVFLEAIEGNHALNNGNGTVSPTKSLADLLDYIAVNGSDLLTKNIIGQYVRKRNRDNYSTKTIEAAITMAKT